ncbi:ATP-grasp domain-containing protein [Rhodocytophaga rosea]|uniref:ATP-grasp domain-containing protein n=1 Tax=Rhodocytophaga rosea TaxID=2704465 RepID=A0A6C0GM80_9BACT|nr:ATP-grasp domain-containing protein [Rhodocytophaga rosea]QHT68924.1 ATP-grasp domain-containing protein [Rhodocytophaga rosea]
MKQVNWVIQKNLIRQETLERLRKAFQEHNISFEEVFVIPFSDELPRLSKPEAFNIFYGSTTLMLTAYNHPVYRQGIFFNPDHFQMATYLSKWGKYLLNNDGMVTSFKEFVSGNYEKDSIWFIRPNADNKSFSGTVMRFENIQEWAENLATADAAELTLDSLLFVSSPKKIDKEWRNFIVEGKVISSCRYQLAGESSVSDIDVPASMLEFVEKHCQEYIPNEIFVMDVALMENTYYIIECNCFNGTGFYQNDMSKIIYAITHYIEKSMINRNS